ncbi:lamin tail domain-containing protein [Halosegnis marinus]|uniref:Lamin tail domain-containing protein n=1 Tax=Halosegnis marinus TaxID=3034023 RepID=A0ABD5ZPW5_9EURY|nr:lamin tail domain-containing protein [Halosegnis sp. DT85]
MRPLAACALALALVVAGCSGVPVSPTEAGDATPRADAPSVPEADLTVTVTRVVDGDTVEIEYPNGTADTVRLVGVDTPEVHAENSPDEFEGVPETEAGRDCLRRWGEAASERMKERLTGAEVGLAFDENLDRRGYYGRLLAYVVHEDRNVNYGLVADGYARVYDSSFSLADPFRAAESSAMSSGTGLWECATESPPTASATATVTASASGLAIGVHADAEGNDNDNLNDEYVTLTNRGDDPLDLSGWTVSDAADHVYEFGTLTLSPGASVRLHTGSGEDTDTDVYWGRTGAVWNNGGDTVTVRAANGTVVAERTY